MLAYIIRRLLLIIPTLIGIMVINFAIVQFAPGGPVEQIIAQLDRHGCRRNRTDWRHRRHAKPAPAHGHHCRQVRGSAGASTTKYRGAQGLDPEFVKQLEKQFGFDKPSPRTLPADDGELSSTSISGPAISATSL